MNAQGSGWGGGPRAGGSVPLPKKRRPFKYFPEKHEIKSPFPPLKEGEGEKILVGRTRQPNSALPAHERRKVVELRKQGLSIAKIEETLGLTNGLVRGALRAEGATFKVTRRTLSDEQIAEIVKRVKAGETKASLAREFGVSPSTIANMVKAATK